MTLSLPCVKSPTSVPPPDVIANGKFSIIEVNTGGGNAGNSSGWVGNDNDGGYAGLFDGTVVSQSDAIMMAGGGGGTGYGHGHSPGGNGGGGGP